MIRGESTPPADPKLRAVFDVVAARPEEFVADAARAGFDVRCTNEVRGLPNRARIKAFRPDAQALVLFAYKDSQVPFSDDRFSYGAVVFKRDFEPALAEALVDFALSGFEPARRPDGLKKTFPYTVPR